MRLLSPVVHGLVDYGVVVAFSLAPLLLGFGDEARYLSWAIAAAHLLLTIVTAFRAGLVRVIPFPVHGAIELIVGLVMLAIPWSLGFDDEAPARNFYVAAGIAVVAAWLVTDYGVLPVGTERRRRA